MGSKDFSIGSLGLGGPLHKLRKKIGKLVEDQLDLERDEAFDEIEAAGARIGWKT